MIIKISYGNTKLGRIASVSFPPQQSCSRGLPCYKLCYAKKAYRKYKETKAAYDANYYLATHNISSFFSQLDHWLGIYKPPFFRWHVSGDIPNQNYLNGMIHTATIFPETKFLCFTKRHYLNFSDLPANLTIILSMWPNWGNTQKDMPRAWMLDPKNSDKRIPADALPCSGHCEGCFVCWGTKNDIILHKH